MTAQTVGSRFGIKARLYGTFGLIACLTALNGGASYLSLTDTVGGIESLRGSVLPSVVASLELAQVTGSLRADTSALTQTDTAEALAVQTQAVTASLARQTEKLDRLKAILSASPQVEKSGGNQCGERKSDKGVGGARWKTPRSRRDDRQPCK
ncbi:hypothetical protein [Elstera litoralis]|uniref:hypothetical protein n=1 Tax=Elstera litoralis TaxID=552518 RepID=UPI0018DCAB90|nr:hypothetical protein [Elstera litoralis]